MSDDELLARLDLAVRVNRAAAAVLGAAIRDQESNTRKMQAAIAELRARQLTKEHDG